MPVLLRDLHESFASSHCRRDADRVLRLPALAEGPPKFADHKVKVYTGKRAKPRLDHEFWRDRSETYRWAMEDKKVNAGGNHVAVVTAAGQILGKGEPRLRKKELGQAQATVDRARDGGGEDVGSGSAAQPRRFSVDVGN